MERLSDIFCVTCYDTLFAPRCRGCRNVCKVGSRLVVADSMTFHEQCLACRDCGAPLGVSPSGRIGLYCKDCHTRARDPLGLVEKQLILAARTSPEENGGDALSLEQPDGMFYLHAPDVDSPTVPELFRQCSTTPGYFSTGIAVLHGDLYMITGHSLLRLDIREDGTPVEAQEVGMGFRLRQGPMCEGVVNRLLLRGLRGLSRISGGPDAQHLQELANQIHVGKGGGGDANAASWFGDRGFLALAPRGTLPSGFAGSTTERDSVVWVDAATAEVTILLQTDLGDAVDMDVRPLLSPIRIVGSVVSAEVELYFWSHSVGLTMLRLILRCDESSADLTVKAIDVAPITWVSARTPDDRPPPGVTAMCFVSAQDIAIVAPRKNEKNGLLLLLGLGKRRKKKSLSKLSPRSASSDSSVSRLTHTAELIGAVPFCAESMAVRGEILGQKNRLIPDAVKIAPVGARQEHEAKLKAKQEALREKERQIELEAARQIELEKMRRLGESPPLPAQQQQTAYKPVPVPIDFVYKDDPALQQYYTMASNTPDPESSKDRRSDSPPVPVVASNITATRDAMASATVAPKVQGSPSSRVRVIRESFPRMDFDCDGQPVEALPQTATPSVPSAICKTESFDAVECTEVAPKEARSSESRPDVLDEGRRLSLKAQMRKRLRKNKQKYRKKSFGKEAATNIKSSISIMQRQLDEFNLKRREDKAPPAPPTVDVMPPTPPPLPPPTPTTDSGKMRIEWLSPEAKREWETQYYLQAQHDEIESSESYLSTPKHEAKFNLDLSVGSGKSPLLQNIEDRNEDLQATMRRRGLLKLAGSRDS